MTESTAPAITVRRMEATDVDTAAQICFTAFRDAQDRHHFPRDFPVPEATLGMFRAWAAAPPIWAIVAEQDGEVVGSVFAHEYDAIPGLGPLSVHSDAQKGHVGRALMTALLERCKGAPSLRGVQDGFNMASLALYTSLGFAVKEPLILVTGKLASEPAAGIDVRPLEEADLPACAALCERVHGFARTNELRAARGFGVPMVALRDGRVTAYASSVTFWPMNYGVAESDADMAALLRGASALVDDPIALLVPLRSPLFTWCRAAGLRLQKPMNLIAIDGYREPRGSWFPNVLY